MTTPKLKIDAVHALGGEVVLHGDSYSDAYGRALQIENSIDRFPVTAPGEGLGQSVTVRIDDAYPVTAGIATLAQL